MNYRKQHLRELLAGEYVLGTLHGAARRRFARLSMDDGRLRAEVAYWEETFSAWTGGLAPVQPPAAVWRRLKAQVAVDAKRQARKSLPKLLQIWSAGAVAAAALVLVLVGVLAGQQLLAPTAPHPTYLAVLSSAGSGPRWIVSVDRDARRIDMQALADNTPPPGKSYELWMLPANGAPVAMGLMNPSGRASETVGPDLMSALARAKGLAISIEPRGGSPTGQPTGPVVYTATLVAG